MIEMPHLPDEVRAGLPPVAQAYIRALEVLVSRQETQISEMHCYWPVYLDSRRPDCSEPWAFISPLFIPDENARIAAKLFGSRQRTSKASPPRTLSEKRSPAW
jgi:hypothetical protein